MKNHPCPRCDEPRTVAHPADLCNLCVAYADAYVANKHRGEGWRHAATVLDAKDAKAARDEERRLADAAYDAGADQDIFPPGA